LGLTLILIGLVMYGLRQVHLRNCETNTYPGSDKPMPKQPEAYHVHQGPYFDAWGPKRQTLRRILNGPHLKVVYESSDLFCVMMLPSRVDEFSARDLIRLVVPEVIDLDQTLEARVERDPDAFLTNAKFGMFLEGTLTNDKGPYSGVPTGRWRWHGLVLFFDWDETMSVDDLGQLENFIADTPAWRSLWGLPALDDTPLQACLRYARSVRGVNT
jgi:hypothetical protein